MTTERSGDQTLYDGWHQIINHGDNEERPAVTYFEAENGWLRASVKWDGCVNLTRVYNAPPGWDGSKEEHTHICDLEELIKQLQDLAAATPWRERPT